MGVIPVHLKVVLHFGGIDTAVLHKELIHGRWLAGRRAIELNAELVLGVL